MSRYVRWKGVIAFGGVTLVLFLLAYFVADFLVERTVEKTGSALVGARVDLDSADLSLFPLGLGLNRLQVTNPDEPMTNAVEVARISFLMDPLQILRRKVIIDEMAVEGVAFNTPRKTSGALPRRSTPPAESPEKSSFEEIPLPALDVPDAREILQKEDLRSLEIIQSVRSEAEEKKQAWDRRVRDLPDRAKFEEYRSRIQAVKSTGKGGLGGILEGASELASLRKDIKTDLDLVREARTALKEDLSLLESRAAEARRAPMEDVRRLRDKYSISPQGLANFSRMLLGGEIGDWVDTALRWHGRLKPLLSGGPEGKKELSETRPLRGRGVDVRFREDQPLPDFLVRTSKVSVIIPAGTLAGTVKQVTSEPAVLGLPLTFQFSGEKMKNLESVRIEGEINRVEPARPRDRVDLEVRGFRVQNRVLSRGQDFPVVLNSGSVGLKGRARVEGESLNARMTGELTAAEIAAGRPEPSAPLAEALARTLSEIRAFDVTAEITGTISDRQTRITSSLDRVLMDAVGRRVKEQADRLEAALRKAVSEKTEDQLAELNSRMGGLTGLTDELADRNRLGDGLLKEAAEGGKKGLKLPF